MKYIYIALISIITVFIFKINISLHSENLSKSEAECDVISQLNFIESELKSSSLGGKMQEIYPEGFVFVNVLYGLTWCEIALSDTNHKIREKALSEALFAYKEINSENGKYIFDRYLKPEYGIFYRGWNNYLLSKILSIDTIFKDSKEFINLYKSQSDTIIEVLKKSKTPYLESYNSQAWPTDMFVAMASLSNYDKIFKPKYKENINSWLIKVKERLDSKTLMIPHKVDYITGSSIESARGCSMSLIIRMLAEIDCNFANEQYRLFKENFVTTRFGLPAVREYRISQLGTGDIDSGPVILGVGFSATIMSLGTMAIMNDFNLGNNQYKTVNAFGFSSKNDSTKSYLIGQLPIADCFIAWGRASGLSYYKSDNTKFWAIKFHLYSFLVLSFLWSVLIWKWIYKHIKTQKTN